VTAVILRADARALPLPDESVDLIVTSPPSEVVAYLAGIIDADGCIRISRYKPYRDRATPGYHARAHVRMVEREAIDLLSETFGGHVWRQKPSLPRARPLYVWDISDAAAQRALEALLPYLRVKHRQAENALALRRLRSVSRQHRTKVIGERVMVGQYGQRIRLPTTCLSDEFVAQCDALYLRAKELNQVGIREEVGGECL